jgi:hypothetical protein
MQMESKYRDPESKNKIKQLKADATKQIERNKVILKDIIRQYHSYYIGLSSVDHKERATITTKRISKEEPSITGTLTATPRRNLPRSSP